MSIRFKFRSCKHFESLDIDGRASISLWELRLMIARQKKLNLGQGFDLIFFNADSGQEYNDENFQIASGSSVIVKRVPAGMMSSTVSNRPPIVIMKDLGLKDVGRINHVDGQVIDFHDFGPDIFSVAEEIFPENCWDFEKENLPGPSNKPPIGTMKDLGLKDVDRINHVDGQVIDFLDFGPENCWDFEKENFPGPRFQYQKLDSIGLNQAIQRGSNHSKIPTKLPEPKTPDAPTFHKEICFSFPVELKCSLCSTFFKNAEMIPCCQYSFCEKCIRLALQEKAMCPKCSSSRCRAEDLLPNLSLRRAIEQILESQMVATQSENALHRYVPDAESCN